jgi:hypothetical protein
MQQNLAIGRHNPLIYGKDRVLFASSEFHSGLKQATTLSRDERGAGGGKVRAGAGFARS